MDKGYEKTTYVGGSKTSKKGKCSLQEEAKTCGVKQEYALWWSWLLFLHLSLQHGYAPFNVDWPFSSMEALKCTPLPKAQVGFNLFLLASTLQLHTAGVLLIYSLLGDMLIPARHLKPSHPAQDLPRKLWIMVNSGMQAFPDLSQTSFL